MAESTNNSYKFTFSSTVSSPLRSFGTSTTQSVPLIFATSSRSPRLHIPAQPIENQEPTPHAPQIPPLAPLAAPIPVPEPAQAAPNFQVAPLYGKLDAYDPSSTISIAKWAYLFQKFCDLNNVPGEEVLPARRRTILINYIGQRAVDYLLDAYAPRDPLEFPITEILAKLEEKFEPKSAISTYRSQFYSRIQKPNESIADFCNALQQLAQKCDWAAHRDQALRDRLQSGVFNQPLKRKLMGMSNATTFDQMRTFALREEALDQQLVQQARLIPPINQVEVGSYVRTGNPDNQNFTVNTQPVQFHPKGSVQAHQNQRYGFSPSSRPNFNTNWRGRSSTVNPRFPHPNLQGIRPAQQHSTGSAKANCWRCGRPRSNFHTPQTCPAKNTSCRTCNKIGHWSAQCRPINFLQAEFEQLCLDSSRLSAPACEEFHQNPEGISSLAVPETSQYSELNNIVGGTTQGVQGTQGATEEVSHESEEEFFLNHLLYD